MKSIGEKHEEAVDAFVEIVLQAIESHPCRHRFLINEVKIGMDMEML